MKYITGQLGTPRGRCDEYSSKIFPQLRNQGLIVQEKSRQLRLKVIRTGLIALQQGHHLTILVDSSSASGNAEPAHTQPNTLFSTYDEVVNLTGLLETKVMSVSSGKQ
jgi:hypothetical protein